jgi:hypothetical protein
MSLATLQNKAPKEVLSLLSAVSTTLLPNPNVGEPKQQFEDKTELIDSVIKEIRHRLNIPDNDNSISAQSKIFDFLSKEISNIALSDENIRKVKKRLGSRGELPLNQYKIAFLHTFESAESFGEKKSHVIEIIKSPDKFVHTNSRYVLLDNEDKYGFTLITKLVTPKRLQDKFIQMVFSRRQGDTLFIMGALRAYLSEMNLNQLDNPLDILKVFVDTYGLTFRVNNLTSRLIENDVTELEHATPADVKILDGQIGNFYLPILIANQSALAGTVNNSSRLTELLLCFVIDLTKYFVTLKKHNVYFDERSTDWLKI